MPGMDNSPLFDSFNFLTIWGLSLETRGGKLELTTPPTVAAPELKNLLCGLSSASR
jgi:hypothetical protein